MEEREHGGHKEQFLGSPGLQLSPTKMVKRPKETAGNFVEVTIDIDVYPPEKESAIE